MKRLPRTVISDQPLAPSKRYRPYATNNEADASLNAAEIAHLFDKPVKVSRG